MKISKKNKFFGIVVVVGVAAIALVTLLAPKPKEKVAEPVVPPTADVLYAKPGRETLLVPSQGTVRARHEIEVVARVGGAIEKVDGAFVPGGFFQADQSLLQIESADYRHQLTRAESQLANAKATLAQEQGRAKQAKREWRDLGSEEANALFLRKPQLAAAEAAVAAARADRDQAKLDLERTRVKTPFAGRVVETYVDLGQYITPGTKLAKIHSTGIAEVRLPLTDRQLALLELPLGQSIENGPAVRLSAQIAGQKREWRGQLVRTEANIDPNSRFVYAVAQVQNPYEGEAPLVNGLFVEADIAGKTFDDVARLPRQALHEGNHLLVLDAENKLRFKTVELLQAVGEDVWVRGDVDPGERVVVSSLGFSREGMVITANPLNEKPAGLILGDDKVSEEPASDETVTADAGGAAQGAR
ncbi:Solvent efflux pump periplasmic linker SrpA precursor [Microbulbifer aggregans]|uniref:Solvent efflux pump periplasmic linker SrpA n=1 Tax=Microbulbifer aggregans TaxID=1769779 RepID=A0A1C9W4K7_9GAMM|nr:efflux RND transporter periplasmic adaptor subunit [Microbulbifer aggregans]AOS96082.1 Solvent efflux pump periplasmic linker SrpA precursor [Microbulbifer aggregans]